MLTHQSEREVPLGHEVHDVQQVHKGRLEGLGCLGDQLWRVTLTHEGNLEVSQASNVLHFDFVKHVRKDWHGIQMHLLQLSFEPIRDGNGNTLDQQGRK